MYQININEYAEIGSQAKLRIWYSLECKSSSLFTRIKEYKKYVLDQFQFVSFLITSV